MEGIREAVWESVSSNQQEKRESLLNKNRSIDNLECTKSSKEDVVKMANDLKRKHITFRQLSELKEVLLLKESVDAFMEVDGALEALVKALSGQNAKLQIGAAYCLCNLSLGDKYLKMIKIAGHYLLLHLHGVNAYLIEACAWTLGNLSSHHKKCVKLLKSQGALQSLSRLLTHSDDSIRVAAAYALSHFVHTGYDCLTGDDFRDMTQPVIALYKGNPDASAAYLTSLLSSHPSCQFKLLQEGVHADSLRHLAACLTDNILQSAWHVRIMGNLVTEATGEAALRLLVGTGPDAVTLPHVVERVVRSGQIFLVRECCWLLGNLWNHPNQLVSSRVRESGVLDAVAGPVRSLLVAERG